MHGPMNIKLIISNTKIKAKWNLNFVSVLANEDGISAQKK
jgi:hypothetical protein